MSIALADPEEWGNNRVKFDVPFYAKNNPPSMMHPRFYCAENRVKKLYFDDGTTMMKY